MNGRSIRNINNRASMIGDFTIRSKNRAYRFDGKFRGKGFEYGRGIYLRRGNGRAYITVSARG